MFWRTGVGRQRAWVVLAVVLALGGTATWYWWPPDDAPPAAPRNSGSTAPVDPRLQAAARWPNVHPDVKYVGDQICAGCHGEIARTYRQHPMGRSLSPIQAASAVERLDADAHNPFTAGAFRYEVERQGARLIHRETATDVKGNVLFQREAPIAFAVGSARRGRSYLIQEDGFLLQSPITWYPQKANGSWDLSPGYEHNNLHFTRPIIPDCLFCHSNRALPLEHATHRYQQPIFQGHAIGCERCHGPGELHVARRQKPEEVEGVDRTIVNPRHLEHALSEAVCQQCHLQGEERVLRRGRKHFDFRPGLPLYEFAVDFVKPVEHQTDSKFVGTVEQMHASRCYQGSRGGSKLGCISCHDPHAVPAAAQKRDFYRERCLRCHAEHGCSIPEPTRLKDNADNCVLCHMPPTGSEVAHTSISDHRIPRRPHADANKASPWPAVDEMPLIPFHHELRQRESEAEHHRDLGVALMQLAARQPQPIAATLARRALPLLDAAVLRDPDDLAAAERRADALWPHGRSDDALAAYQAILAKAPQREFTLQRAGSLALRLKRLDLAEDFIRSALKVNPQRWQSHLELASVQAQRREFREAIAACRRALEVNPASLPVRSLLISCYLALGEQTQAQVEREIAQRLR